MEKITIDKVFLSKTHDEPKTRYQRANEDRLNMNLKRLQEAIEELQKRLDEINP